MAKNSDKNTPVLERTHVGRKSSQSKQIGDALIVGGAGAGSALWSVTRPGPQSIYWALGLMAASGLGMIESQPGTLLESGSAGMLGANSAVLLLRLLNLTT